MRTLYRFAAVALPTGWLLLTPPVLLHLPVEPFVLGTLLFALVLPALLLSRGEPGGVRALLRDTVRRPRSWWLLVPAVALIPVLTWALATAAGAARTTSPTTLAVNIATSVVIVNLWEELVWTGFVQRRAMTRWGVLNGSLVTAGLFAALHLPLAYDGARTPMGVLALVVSGIGLRLLIAAGDAWSGRSLLVAALIHASFNAAALVVAPDHDWIRYAVTLTLGLLTAAALVPARRTAPAQA